MDIRDASVISGAVRSGQVTAREVAAAALQRIEALDAKLGAFLTVEPERVLARADEIDRT